MPSTKKLTVYRKSQFAGPRRRQPQVRVLNRAIRDRIADEQQLLDRLVRDADIRLTLVAPYGRPDPFLVWNDFDHASSTLTEVNLHHLPEWKDIGEFLKLHLLFQVALADGGYAFTARVRPDLEAKWKVEGRDPMDRIRRLVARSLVDRGLGNIEYAYVVETRTRKGSGRTPLHLHGFFLAQDAHLATRFKVALEDAIAVHPLGRAASGVSLRSGPEVDVEPVYDVIDDSPHGRGRWASYIAKNIVRWDQRFRRRIFMSRTATQTAREFWSLVREDPIL